MATQWDLNDIPRITLPRGIAPIAIAGGLVIWALFSAVFTVPAESVGVIQRFGHYHGEVNPGLHFKLPFGVDRVTLVPVKRQLKEEFGFSTPGASFADQASAPNQWVLETTMVTGDLNTALVEWIIQFRIEKAFDFLFKVRNPGATLRDVSESVMREVIGDRTVDEVLTIGRQEIESTAQVKLQEVVNKYEMGLRIDQIQLKNVNPPKPVQASFDRVNEAQQERERMINVARGEYNKAVPRARGEADQRIQAAEGYAIQRVNEAEGDVRRFNALLAEYLKGKDVTKRRLYLETLKEVLPRVETKVIVDESASSVLPLLQLGTTNARIAK
jgi:modulator of FtsH protease HflK